MTPAAGSSPSTPGRRGDWIAAACGILAWSLPLAIYSLLPSRLWNFDGVACAAALELGTPVFFFHSNHLLYGFAGFLFWKIFFWPFGMFRALPALQILTSVLSAAALGVLFHLLRRRVNDPVSALGLVLAAATGAVAWTWSIEAQVYTLGLFGLALATHYLQRPENHRRWLRVGLSHALAVLGHAVHVLWLAPALYWLLRHERTPDARRTALRVYGFSLGAGVLIPYLAVLAGVVMPLHQGPEGVQRWLLGSIGLTASREWGWHSEGWGGPLHWAWTTLRFFWGSLWPYAGVRVSLASWACTGLSAAALGWILARSWRVRKDPAWRFSVLWLAVYGLFFWTWEPRIEPYRLSDLIPWAILCALGLERFRSLWIRRGVVAILAGALLMVNAATRALPMSQAANNRLYEETRRLAERTPEGSLYLTTGGLSWIYLLYFTGRSAWNVRLLPPDRLPDQINRHRARAPVYIRNNALSDDHLRNWLSGQRVSPVEEDLPWMQVR